MPMTNHASLVIAISAMLLLGCGGDSENSEPASKVEKVCTERDGAWFGRLEDGTGIISQTQEACEERL